jgi:mRNA-degrading endonuclease RelE of RelBE toxin-antitoxin system
LRKQERILPYFERLKDRQEYRLRVGQYRLIASIEGKQITILDIGHRKNIYD